MPTIRRSFSVGIMDKDTDERLLPDGVVRHASNVNTNTSEASDEGSVENVLSNKKLTEINFGANTESTGGYSDTTNNKLYWFVVSNTGSFLMEYNANTKSTARVLADTRPPNLRVLNLRRGNRITGIGKIITNSENDDLFIWTDNNMEICCINIARAKRFPENGFTKEDIYLIKKPPKEAPTILPINLAVKSNDLSQKFLSFAYRYQYKDGEYSALSPFSRYAFTPKKYDIDYYELVNKGMVNAFNAIRVSFETGDRQVKKIQLCFKESNSNNIYLIDTFSKKQEGLADNVVKTVNFVNNKIYKLLPEKELFRLFDNVPKKAKALSLMDNRIALGHYTDGYNFDEKPFDYSLSLNSYELDNDIELDYEYFIPYLLIFNSPTGVEYSEGSVLIIYLSIQFEGVNVYENSFQLILTQNYPNLNTLLNSDYFQEFLNFINIDLQANYNQNGEWDVPPNYELVKDPKMKLIYMTDDRPAFNLESAVYKNVDNNQTINIPTHFGKIYGENGEMSPIQLSNNSSSASCKTNQSYSVGIIYRDEFGRASTVQTVQENTLFIPQSQADESNKIQVKINHKAPSWAHDFKLAVKTNPLIYQTIYINEFYNDGVFVWCKLEESNKDKVKVGDYLNVKLASGVIMINPIQIKVLDIKSKESNFLEHNETETATGDLIDIIEPEGLYMKIRPTAFSMDRGDYAIYQDESTVESDRASKEAPRVYLSLQTTISEDGTKHELPVGIGTSIRISLYSKRKYDKNHNDFQRKGWNEVLFEKEFFATKDYDTIEDWFNENLLNGNTVLAKHTGTNKSTDIASLLKLRRGKPGENQFDFFDDPSLGLFLEYISYYDGPSGSRSTYAGGKITIRTSTGIYVFETEPNQIESQVYFETPETYPIINRNHISKIDGSSKINSDQNFNNSIPAIIEMSFFNCFAQGNGIESYRVFDDFNTNYLNIDLRPSLVSSEQYREVTRYADMTYGEAYIESSNINGLNEFNASTANWKELNKQDGPIQVLHGREGNLLVVQENKWGYVLFNKNALHTSDGSKTITGASEVLGEHIPYAGVYGTSHPESFAVSGTRCYAVDRKRGTVLRLSQDGLTEITRGMKNWFRENLSRSKFAKIIGGIDPYNFNRYQITINESQKMTPEISLGQSLIKYRQAEEFNYLLELDDSQGVNIHYKISEGEIFIKTSSYQSEELSGSGTLELQKKKGDGDRLNISITPTSELASYELNHIEIKNTTLMITSVVLGSENKLGKTMTNGFSWGDSQFYMNSDLFVDADSSRYVVETGEEGAGKFPKVGESINMKSLKKNSDTGSFDLNKGHRLMYLVSNESYDNNSRDLQRLINDAEPLRVRVIQGDEETRSGEINTGSFIFQKQNENDQLYLIWDYTDK